MTKHPTYPNPTIIEALCEIHFSARGERVWSPTQPLPLYCRLQATFPVVEVVPELAVHLEFSPDGPKQSVQKRSQRVRLSNAQKTRMLQISSDVWVYNVLSPYPGWPRLKEDLLELWNNCSDILEPQAIFKIGLRYINKIENTSEDQSISLWLQPTERIPSGILNSANDFSATVEISFDENHRLVETLRCLRPDDAMPFGATIFDIDRSWQGSAENTSAAIASLLERLHEDVWAEFDAAITPALRKKLETENELSNNQVGNT